MKVAFIVVLHNTPESEKLRLTNEIKNLHFQDYQIYWVDNTVQNRGYAGGINAGIQNACLDKPDLFIILNPDVSFGTLNAKSIMKPASAFDMWSFAMKQNGTVYYGGSLDPWRLSGHLNSRKPRTSNYTPDYLTGSLLVIKKSVFEKVGLFDETFFMYYEDTDYSRRLKSRNVSFGIDTNHHYVHYEKSDSNPSKEFWLAKNHLKFFLKYAGPLQFIREIIRFPKTLWERRRLIQNFVSNSVFLKSFFSLNVSSILIKSLQFILFFVLIRNLTVSEYGIYTFVWAHVSLLAPLLDLGTTSYGMIYISANGKSQFSTLFSLRFILSILVFVFSLLLGVVFRYDLKIMVYVFLCAIVNFFNFASGTYLIITSVYQKLVRTALLSLILNSVMVCSLILGILFLGKLRYVFLIFGFFYVIYTAVYLMLVKQLIPLLCLKIEVKKWFFIIRRSYVFVFIGLFAGIYFKIDVLLLSFLKGKDAVGIYSSGYKFFEALILIASSYNTVALPLFSQMITEDKQGLYKRVKKHLLLLLGIGAFTILATFLVGPLLFPLILKGSYRYGFSIVNIVIFALPLILLNSVLLNVLYAGKRFAVVMILFVLLGGVNILLNYIFIPSFSYTASAYITVLCELISFCILSYIVFIRFRKELFI